jgi:hypothetical protein
VNLIAGLLLLGLVVYQWFSQEAGIKLWGPWRIGFHRDEWPAFYWVVMVLECGLAGLFIYWAFA